MIKRVDLVREICRKAKINRKQENLPSFDKRELTLLLAYLDITAPPAAEPNKGTQRRIPGFGG